MRILVVDDEPDVLDVVREFLTSVGHDVTCKPSGREALDGIDVDNPYDVALVDLHMPGINGRDVVAGIKSRTPGTAIIMTTGELRRPVRPATSWSHVLRKPFRLKELAARIEQLGPKAAPAAR